MPDPEEKTSEKTPLVEAKVSRSTKFSYALGHVFNDLAAAMWFSYTLLFFQRVALLQPIVAGSIMLLGQLSDAVITPVLGVFVDRYAKKKQWHVYGSIMVAITFPLIYGTFVRTRSAAMLVYILGTVIFQIGWAAVQISHLSMIPVLSSSPLVRSELTAIRYSAQVIAAIITFTVTWVILPNRLDFFVRVGPQDDFKFRRIVLVLTGIGIAASVLFHELLNSRLLETSNTSVSEIPSTSATPVPTIEVAGTKDTETLSRRRRRSITTRVPGDLRPAVNIMMMVAFLYASARLFTALSTVYLPLYLVEANVGGKQTLATVPLLCYLSSFATSLFLKHLSRPYGSKACFLWGTLIGLSSAAVIYFSDIGIWEIYLTAFLIGVASSITMVAALSITADIIGPRTENSAFVYSVVTFLDKVLLGVIIFLIEKWRCKNTFNCPNYNRDVLTGVCVTTMGIGAITLIVVARFLPNNN